MLTIPLHGEKAAGRGALVDDSDYELVMRYRWHLWERRRSGWITCGPYARTSLRVDSRNTSMYMHVLITGFAEVDHQDGDGLNNQRYNLRDSTHSQNQANQRKQSGTTSRFKGVSWDKDRGMWRAQVHDGPTHYLGRFADEIDAALAYDAAARAAWGEYAHVNFPKCSEA